MAVSRAFDDKCGVWVACRVMEKLASRGRASGVRRRRHRAGGDRNARRDDERLWREPRRRFGFRRHACNRLSRIDKGKHGKIVCGDGPVIARGPNINPIVFERLVAAAEAEGILYQIEAEPSVTGTDARAIQVTRSGVPTGLVSVPLRYMHTPTEVVCLKDLQSTVKLITRFALDLDEGACFVPASPSPSVMSASPRRSRTLRSRGPLR